MENRDWFLSRKLNNKKNLYKGNFNDIIKFNSNHKDQYIEFIKQFKTKGKIYDEAIEKLTSKKDFIVDNESIYIFFIASLSVERVNILKLHLVENFLVNWMEEEKFFQTLLPDSKLVGNHLSISSISGSDIFDRRFNHDLISDEEMYSDIQFITLSDNSKSKYKGEYDSAIKAHLTYRNGRGLITFIFYLGSESAYKENNYEVELYSQRIIVKETIKLNDKETEFAEKHKSIINESNITELVPNPTDVSNNLLDDPFGGV